MARARKVKHKVEMVINGAGDEDWGLGPGVIGTFELHMTPAATEYEKMLSVEMMRNAVIASLLEGMDGNRPIIDVQVSTP